MKPFEPNKTAEELGIDKTRKFVVVSGNANLYFIKGSILIFLHDNGPEGKLAFFQRISDGFCEYAAWSDLAYAEEEGPEPYVPRVGDRVSLEGYVVDCFDGPEKPWFRMRLGKNGCLDSIVISGEHVGKYTKLISRKSPRKVTMEEVREKFGEDVEIVGE